MTTEHSPNDPLSGPHISTVTIGDAETVFLLAYGIRYHEYPTDVFEDRPPGYQFLVASRASPGAVFSEPKQTGKDAHHLALYEVLVSPTPANVAALLALEQKMSASARELTRRVVIPDGAVEAARLAIHQRHQQQVDKEKRVAELSEKLRKAVSGSEERKAIFEELDAAYRAASWLS